jgi:hypothetical protein
MREEGRERRREEERKRERERIQKNKRMDIYRHPTLPLLAVMGQKVKTILWY